MFDKLNRNFADVRSFGPGVLGRHLARITRARHVDLTLRQVSKVRIRADDSHISSIRQVFDDQQYRLGGAFEKRARAAYDAMLAAGITPLIVDAGANIGAASLWFARAYPRAVIVAIEPEDENYGLFERNIAGYANIRAVQAAVGGESGFVDVHAALNSTGTVTTRSDAGTATIAEAVASVASGRLFIAKIDIEGFEKDLFAGDVGWIDDAQAVYVEPHD
jgi:FkbM family methyltransferase